MNYTIFFRSGVGVVVVSSHFLSAFVLMHKLSVDGTKRDY